MNTKITLGAIGILLTVMVGYSIFFRTRSSEVPLQAPPKANLDLNLDAIPQNVTLTGTYVCLPHINTSGPQTEECAFGIKTDKGDYYAVNFGESDSAMQQFQSGVRITAEGNIVIKQALSSDHWAKYNMKGIFTITRLPDTTSTTTEDEVRSIYEI